MLPTEHDCQYQKFSQFLHQLQQIVAQENQEPGKILAIVGEVQKFFDTHIISLDNSELDPSTTSQVQSYVIEIHKQLRLLNLDVTFLQVSQTSETTQTRLASIDDRVETLRGYCLTILDQINLTQNQEQR